MEFLEGVAGRIDAKKFSILDVGTGSGILAIAGALLGAAEIRAVDNDPVALQVALENLRANRVADRVCVSGAKLSALRSKFDVVVANLTAETIVELAGDLQKKVAARGFLILSGILHPKAGVITRAFAGRFRVIKRKRSREWVTLLLQRK
jgi:ribosomal protein L11 methyltransferase